jgi:hypothetical protein
LPHDLVGSTDQAPGTAIFIVAFKKGDGTLSAGRVTAEKDGIVPPM